MSLFVDKIVHPNPGSKIGILKYKGFSLEKCSTGGQKAPKKNPKDSEVEKVVKIKFQVGNFEIQTPILSEVISCLI